MGNVNKDLLGQQTFTGREFCERCRRGFTPLTGYTDCEIKSADKYAKHVKLCDACAAQLDGFLCSFLPERFHGMP